MQPLLLALALSLSPEELEGRVKALKDSVKEITTDVTEIKEHLGMPAGPAPVQGKCECKPLPDNIKRGEDGNVTTGDGLSLLSTYGASCAAHDMKTASCGGEYKAAYCYEAWCYVDKDCAEADTKSSFYFGKEVELYYSYKNCGGLDAFAAEACFPGKDEKACTDISENCAWSSQGVCQNKLCQCSGSNGGMDTAALGFDEKYGEQCGPWDQQTCEEFKKSSTSDTQLGLWCCKNWCYVDESCPSAKASAVSGTKDLFYSYYACPDKADALDTCKWDEPINFDGSPIALSSSSAAALNEAAKTAGFLKKMRKHHRIHRERR